MGKLSLFSSTAFLSLIAVGSIMTPIQLLLYVYGSSFEYSMQYINVQTSAKVLDGIAKVTTYEQNVTSNVTIEVTKCEVVDSYLYFSIYNNGTFPVYVSYIGIEGLGLLFQNISIAPYQNLTGYIKLRWNVTPGSWWLIWFTINNIAGYSCPFNAFAQAVNVTNSTFSHTIDVYPFALVFGDYKTNNTSLFNITIPIDNQTLTTPMPIYNKTLITNKSFVVYGILNTGPTEINLTSITIDGIELLNKTITIEPYQFVENVTKIPSSFRVVYHQNYTIIFTFITPDNTTEETDENIFAI